MEFIAISEDIASNAWVFASLVLVSIGIYACSIISYRDLVYINILILRMLPSLFNKHK